VSLTEVEATANAEQIIHSTIRSLLERRGAADQSITGESRLTADLGLDSLELAELSAVLEDEIGHDPYSQGLVPDTVAELVAFYG
jgi:acyl carrier protein